MSQRTDTGLYFDAEARAMEKRDRELIPRRLVIALFSMALAAVLLAAFAVLTDRPLEGQLIEGTGNAIKATDASTGEVVLDLRNGGFISVVNDGLERARLVSRVTENPAVKLTLYETGRLSLTDPATGWSTEISSFGPGNIAVWLNLLKK